MPQPRVSWQCWESLLARVGSRGGHKARVSNPNGCHEDRACWWPPVALLGATRWVQGHGECQSHSWSCWVVQQSSSPGCSPALFREEARMPKELLGHHHLVPSRGAPPAAHAPSSGCWDPVEVFAAASPAVLAELAWGLLCSWTRALPGRFIPFAFRLRVLVLKSKWPWLKAEGDTGDTGQGPASAACSLLGAGAWT